MRASLLDNGDRVRRIELSGFFRADDIEWICETYFAEGTGPGTLWDRVLRDAHMSPPEWYRSGLDPLSEAYAAQQHQLWQLVAGIDRPYEPVLDEKEHSWADIDPIRGPGFFARRDPLAVSSASDHVLATGMLLKHSGLKPGDAALEYGAGFGHTALTLARLGVLVDTVDISTTFCDFIRQQATFFGVSLNAFHGQFGFNPRPGLKYKAIWFYESFHHCVDFRRVVDQLHDLLEPGGKVLLGGEPIVEREYAAVPYPWGLRLHSEVVAVVRRQGWFELGFSEDFLYELFTAAGFSARRIDCEASLFGRLFVFEHRSDTIELGSHWMPPLLAEQWHGAEPLGRWTRASSTLPIDASGRFASIEVDVANLLRRPQAVTITYGEQQRWVEVAPGQEMTIRFETSASAKRLEFTCSPQRPSWRDRARTGDRRSLGVFVKRVRYLPQS